MFNYIIHQATVCDGSGTPAFTADVGIQDDRITAVEPEGIDRELADYSIEGQALVLAPGFIDAHSHSDYSILVNPKAESKLLQGVTTDVYGQCGFSAQPLTDKNRSDLRRELKNLGLDPQWSTFSEYRERVEQSRPGLNAVSFVGHGTIRAAVMGFDARQPTVDELKEMENHVRQALDEGAAGLSSGLQYPPGLYAESGEVATLSKAAAEKGGLYATHMRSEGDGLIESIEETLDVTQHAQVPTIISHLKASGHHNWGKAALAITLIEIARRKGLPVFFDRYPYLATSTGLDVYMPAWAHAGGREALTKRLESGDALLVEEFRKEVEEKTAWEKILIADTSAGYADEVLGRNLAQIATDWKVEPWDAAVKLLIDSQCQVGMCNFMMCQEDTDRVLAHPLCMIGSDSSIASPRGPLGRKKPHPRAYGTFPRFLSQYVRERKIVSLEEAIRRMTLLPAEVLKLKDRGAVRRGYYADLVLFQLEEMEDHARYGDPHHYPSGIRHVFVNGVQVVRDGNHTGECPGRLLSPGKG